MKPRWRAGSVVTALGFFVIGVASLLLGGNEGSALAFIGIAVVGVLACELVGLLRRHQRMG